MSDKITSANFLAPLPKRRHAPKLLADRNGNRIRGIYYDENGRFWERPKVKGKRTWFILKTTSPTFLPTDRIIEQLIAERADRRNKQAGATIGNGRDIDPYLRATTPAVMTLQQLADFYLESGCPKRRTVGARTKQTLDEEKKRVAKLTEWWQRIDAAKIEPGQCRQYGDWRKNRMRAEFAKRYENIPEQQRPQPPRGDRQVDKELITLSNVLWWGVQNSTATGLKTNPLRHDRPTFVDKELIRHCREFMPKSADELHAIARMLFNDGPRSEVLGWQALAEAMIGHRTSEILRLRWDAKNEDQPGYIEKTTGGRRLLWLHKSKSSKGTYPYIEIHPMLGKMLDALKAWHDRRYPKSPWFFPSNLDEGLRPVLPNSLSHALARIASAMGLPHRTSHGLRAFFATVLRSGGFPGRPEGIPDPQVATMMGQKSGGRLIVTTYGETPKEPLTWNLAKGNKPAWEVFETQTIRPATVIAPSDSLHQLDLFEPLWVQVELPI